MGRNNFSYNVVQWRHFLCLPITLHFHPVVHWFCIVVVLSTLNEFEKKTLCNSHFRVEIKRTRVGRFRFTEDMNFHQSQRKIKCHSLLFTRPGPFIKAFRGTDCVGKLSKDAGLQNPKAAHFIGTNLELKWNITRQFSFLSRTQHQST